MKKLKGEHKKTSLFTSSNYSVTTKLIHTINFIHKTICFLKDNKLFDNRAQDILIFCSVDLKVKSTKASAEHSIVTIEDGTVVVVVVIVLFVITKRKLFVIFHLYFLPMEIVH